MLLSLPLTSANFNLLKVATDLILKNWDSRCYLVLLAWRSDRVSDGCPDGAALIMIPGYQPPTSNTAFHIGVFCILHRIFCIFFALCVFFFYFMIPGYQPPTSKLPGIFWAVFLDAPLSNTAVHYKALHALERMSENIQDTSRSLALHDTSYCPAQMNTLRRQRL